jgi:hypothetical protein
MLSLFLSLFCVYGAQSKASGAADSLGQCAEASIGPKAFLSDQNCSGLAIRLCAEFIGTMAASCRNNLTTYFRTEADEILRLLPAEVPEDPENPAYFTERLRTIEKLSTKKNCSADLPNELCQALLAEAIWLNTRSLARELALPGYEEK